MQSAPASPASPPSASSAPPAQGDLKSQPVPPGTKGFIEQTGGILPQPAMRSALPYFYDPDQRLSAAQPVPSGFEFDSGMTPKLELASSPFDPRLIRRDFPILQEQVHGRPLVWLDNAATTQKPNAVIDRLTYFYRHENSNIHRAAHTLAARATDAYESAREKTRRFLNASSTREIVFVRGATEGINLVAKSWGHRHVEKDDEIVITWLEHHANIVPWQQLCAEKGARLRVAPVDDRGEVILEEYEKLFTSRTKLAAFSHVSNALGTVTPARAMIEIAHRHGALVLLDGAQSVSHMREDVQALDCDFFVFSGHKIFAPTGIGVVYGKAGLLDTTPPWQGGGNMIQDVTFEKTTYQPAPARFEAGTGNIADAVGLGAALDYLEQVGMETVSRYEHELLNYATAGLASVPGLRMIGTARDKAGVLSFVLDGVRTEDIGKELDGEGIAVRAGHHCAQPILRRFGVESTVRASLALYNTCEDIDALISALLRIQSGRGHRGL
jgi:cysteine desulfurase/selenocysteine lyase